MLDRESIHYYALERCRGIIANDDEGNFIYEYLRNETCRACNRQSMTCLSRDVTLDVRE